jgi:NAD(P)-dependent dehydrogenase (short-subunit alcohol dehydrogenase family)
LLLEGGALMSPIVIAGATRGVGFEIARLERARGRMVIALVRPGSNAGELRRIGADLIWGDALDRSDLRRLFEGLPTACDVVSTLPGSADDGRRVDDFGNVNLIDAATEAGLLGRFLLVTPIGCGEMALNRSDRQFAAFGAAAEAKTRAEEYLRRSSLLWTILRRGERRSAPAAGGGMLATDARIHRSITWHDAAQLVFQALRDPSTIRKALAAVDISQASSVNALAPPPLMPVSTQNATNWALNTLNS